MKKTRNRRTDLDIFSDAIRDNIDEETGQASNSSVKKSLPTWNEKKYYRVRSEALEVGAVVAHRGGPGGLLSLASTPDQPLKLFISYSHKDKTFRDGLDAHLMPLRRNKIIETWSDIEIKPGDLWEKEIALNLKTADIIILLISIDFINSSFCYDIEFGEALIQHGKGQTKIIPVIVRDCLWRSLPLKDYQSLPTDVYAVANWPDRDSALSNVAEGIQKQAESILAKRRVRVL
jgi:TIR domain